MMNDIYVISVCQERERYLVDPRYEILGVFSSEDEALNAAICYFKREYGIEEEIDEDDDILSEYEDCSIIDKYELGYDYL